jgi:hypothetical protein
MRNTTKMAKVIYLQVKYKFMIVHFPNFHYTGSVKGMKEKYYGKSAYLVRCGSYIYHVPYPVYMYIWRLAK